MQHTTLLQFHATYPDDVDVAAATGTGTVVVFVLLLDDDGRRGG